MIYTEFIARLNAPRKVELPKYWIHLGNAALSPYYFGEISNCYGFTKPSGGLWASPLALHNNYVSDWHECSEMMGFTIPPEACVFEFKKDARVFIIDSQPDLMKLFQIVGDYTPVELDFELTRMKTLDFEKASKLYDVIYLTERGQLTTRLPIENPSYNLYGWDCESCVVLNFDVIAKQRPVKIRNRVK